MSFDLNNYETVKERKTRFYADHPDGRITCEIWNPDLDEKAVVIAKVFINREDQLAGLPRGIGHALEIRDKNLSISSKGKEFESVNFSSWLENCEESAIGRALDNSGYASNGRCSREEILKAQRNSQTIQARGTDTKPNSAQPSAVNGQSTVGSGPANNSIHEFDARTVIVPFGKNKGKRLSDLKDYEVRNDVTYWRQRETADRKPLSGKLNEYILACEWLVSKYETPTAPTKKWSPPVDEPKGEMLFNEDVPAHMQEQPPMQEDDVP